MKFYKKRSFRTVLLALFATIAFVGSAIFMFDVEPRMMGEFFLVSLLGLALLMTLALLFTALRIVIKRFFS